MMGSMLLVPYMAAPWIPNSAQMGTAEPPGGTRRSAGPAGTRPWNIANAKRGVLLGADFPENRGYPLVN